MQTENGQPNILFSLSETMSQVTSRKCFSSLFQSSDGTTAKAFRPKFHCHFFLQTSFFNCGFIIPTKASNSKHKLFQMNHLRYLTSKGDYIYMMKMKIYCKVRLNIKVILGHTLSKFYPEYTSEDNIIIVFILQVSELGTKDTNL